jgi:hypothetical protein
MREGVLEEVDGLQRRQGGACEGQECGANTARECVNSWRRKVRIDTQAHQIVPDGIMGGGEYFRGGNRGMAWSSRSKSSQ